MEVILNDANILIDLYRAGILPYCKLLNLKFCTLDVIIAEIKDEEQYLDVQKIIDEGTLAVYSLTGKQVGIVVQKVAEYKGQCNLSAIDISALVFAKDNNCRLITGDKKLRKKAILENVIVSGVLFITDTMIEEKVVSNDEMVAVLERLLSTNERLPRNLINERIEALKSQQE